MLHDCFLLLLKGWRTLALGDLSPLEILASMTQAQFLETLLSGDYPHPWVAIPYVSLSELLAAALWSLGLLPQGFAGWTLNSPACVPLVVT